MASNVLRRINMHLFENYRKINGDLLIPSKFVIPNVQAWPEETHGMKLGLYVDRIRENAKHKVSRYSDEDLKHLMKIGFQMDFAKFQANEALKAFQTYKSQFNTTNIDKQFKIPHGDMTWPKTLWGRSLYNLQINMQNKPNEFESTRNEITELGFDLTRQLNAATEFDTVLSALKAYKGVHGNLLVKLKFEVPFDDERYPVETWGMKLGKIVYRIRSEEVFTEHKEQLKEVGVEYDTVLDQPSFKNIYSAIKTYKKLNNGDISQLKQGFTIPSDDLRYNQNVWGLQLGNIVHSMRTKGTYKQFSKELEQVGIIYDDNTRDASFEQKYQALVAYKNVHGHVNVPHRFQIPQGDAQYPEETWGLKLGVCVKRIRTKNYYSKYHKRLVDLGIVFKTTASTATEPLVECD